MTSHPPGACNKPFCPRSPVGCKFILDLINDAGFAAEPHSVTTDDGYILSLQRLINNETAPSSELSTESPPASAAAAGSRPVVLLQHGIVDAAATWVVNGNRSLSAILSGNGCDVWLGNSRGNRYSRCHQTLDADENASYWQWSWDQMQQYDLPAMVDYILSITQQQQLFYVGHSQGALIGFAAFSTNTQLADKIKAFVALSPVGTLSNMKGALRDLASLFKTLPILQFMGNTELASNSNSILEVSRYLSSSSTGDSVMESLFFQCSGPNDNVTRENYPFPTIFSYYPAGTSSRNLNHFIQMSADRKMQSFDKNTVYNMEDMKVYTLLYYGTNDFVASEQDVEQFFLPRLPNHKARKMEGWNFMDFIWGKNNAPEIYAEISSEILKLNGQQLRDCES